LLSGIKVIINSKDSPDKVIYKYENFNNLGKTSWSEFAKEIFKLEKLNYKVAPISSEQYPTPAIRPKNSTLSKKKIKNHFKLQIPSWHQSLKECLNEII